MRVLITGGNGLVGKLTTRRLLQAGWDVRVIGIETGVEISGAEYTTCDILDYAKLREQVRGCQGIVHLGAISNPRVAPGSDVFRVNVAGTFNVFEAAAAEGIKRVVQASSINALGAMWSIDDMRLHYFPIDEAHPTYTTDPYSFSKQMVEDIGAYYWRRDGISSAAFRLPGVWRAEALYSPERLQRFETARAALDALLAEPEAVQRERIADIRKRALTYRSTRPLEYSDSAPEWPKQSPDSDWLWFAYVFDRFNFWAYIHEADSALAFEKALTADYDGSHTLFINSSHNWLGYDTEAILRLFYPNVTARTRPIRGSESLVSIDKARDLIGFEPEHLVHLRHNI